jgi:hypothetical protein
MVEAQKKNSPKNEDRDQKNERQASQPTCGYQRAFHKLLADRVFAAGGDGSTKVRVA